jgi:hypothetical protein
MFSETELILNPYESEYIGIILIQDKIQSFLIKGKSFLNRTKDYQSPGIGYWLL